MHPLGGRAQFTERLPGLIHGLTRHPGIGFLLVVGEEEEGYVIGARGSVELLELAT